MLKKLIAKVNTLLQPQTSRSAGGGMGFTAGVSARVIHKEEKNG